MKTHPIVPIQFISSGAGKLYELEHIRSEAIRKASKELAVVLEHKKEDFYRTTMPQALANILESYERPCSIAAALMYLAQYGEVQYKMQDGDTIGVAQTEVFRG